MPRRNSNAQPPRRRTAASPVRQVREHRLPTSTIRQCLDCGFVERIPWEQALDPPPCPVCAGPDDVAHIAAVVELRPEAASRLH